MAEMAAAQDRRLKVFSVEIMADECRKRSDRSQRLPIERPGNKNELQQLRLPKVPSTTEATHPFSEQYRENKPPIQLRLCSPLTPSYFADTPQEFALRVHQTEGAYFYLPATQAAPNTDYSQAAAAVAKQTGRQVFVVHGKNPSFGQMVRGMKVQGAPVVLSCNSGLSLMTTAQSVARETGSAIGVRDIPGAIMTVDKANGGTIGVMRPSWTGWKAVSKEEGLCMYGPEGETGPVPAEVLQKIPWYQPKGGGEGLRLSTRILGWRPVNFTVNALFAHPFCWGMFGSFLGSGTGYSLAQPYGYGDEGAVAGGHAGASVSTAAAARTIYGVSFRQTLKAALFNSEGLTFAGSIYLIQKFNKSPEVTAERQRLFNTTLRLQEEAQRPDTPWYQSWINYAASAQTGAAASGCFCR